MSIRKYAYLSESSTATRYNAVNHVARMLLLVPFGMTAHADIHIGVGVLPPPLYYGPPPAYYRPPPPVYYGPGIVYGPGGWGPPGAVRPPPLYYGPPPAYYRPPPPVYYGPGIVYGGGDWNSDDDEDDDDDD